MRYSLAPGWKVDFFKNEIVIKNEIRGVSLKKIDNIDKIFSHLSKEDFNLSDIGEQLSFYLIKENIIKESNTLTLNVVDYKYRKQIDFWKYFNDHAYSVHQSLSEKKVAIVGLGGIGSIVLEVLAGAGVKNFTLVDCDKVEASNLNRQFIYQECDVGRYKTDSAAKNISKRHSDLNISKLNIHYPLDDFRILINESDFIVSAIDQPSLKSAIKLCQECWESNKPSAFSACGVYKAVMSPIFDKNKSNLSPMAGCKFLNEDESLITSPVSASSGGWNSMISSILAEQILLYLAGVDKEVSYQDYTYVLRNSGKIQTIHKNTITL